MERVLQNRYRINQIINIGGMSRVYAATDLRLNKDVVIKCLDSHQFENNDEELLEKLKQTLHSEALLMAQLNHHAIPKVFDYFTDNETQYLVMELVSGVTLQKVLAFQQENFTTKQIFDWFFQLIDIIEYLHSFEAPIIHRDIKPSNIKLDNKGKIHLLDFGISKSLNDPNKITDYTMQFATLEFAPLEQSIQASKQIEQSLMAINPQKTQAILNEKTSIQTDIFSLGATLYRFLTGKLPNSAFNRALSVWLGNDDPLLPPSVLNQNLPSEIDGVILRSMSILPSNRTVSVTEFKNTLQKVTKSGSVLLPQTEELQPDNKKGRSSSLPRFSNRHFDSYLNEIFQLRAKILQQEEELFKLKKYQQPQLINLRSIPNRVYSE